MMIRSAVFMQQISTETAITFLFFLARLGHIKLCFHFFHEQ